MFFIPYFIQFNFMPKEIFYQSSLPRSGSTMLQNLLMQNPKIHATPTDGLLELVVGAQNNYTYSPEFKAQDAETMQKAFLGFCKSGMMDYCNQLTDREYVINNSRGWGIYSDLLRMMFQEPKIICMVRDLRDVFASMEKNHRKSPDKASDIIRWNEMRGTTLAKRIDVWVQNPPIGMATDRLLDIFAKGFDKHILFIKYEDLCLYPSSTMTKIYQYLNIDYYEHDFDNIEQVTKEEDGVYGIADLHTIRTKLQMKPSDARAILGKDICDWIYNHYQWFFDYFNYKK
jgi:sulfotransferase